MYIDRNGRNSHTGALYRDAFSFVVTCKPEHVADFVVAYYIIQESFGNVLCSERISWKQYSVCDVAFFCIDVNTHFLFSFNFKNCSVLQPIPVILKGFVIYREWHACVGEIGRASCRERMWLEGG